MKKASTLAGGIKIGLGLALLAALTGCVGYVGGGGGGAVVVDGPGYVEGGFGGYYDEGRSVHGYSGRGSASRAVAHGGGGHGGRR
jgi:hypothetical protein